MRSSLGRRSVLAGGLGIAGSVALRRRRTFAAKNLHMLCWGGYDDPNLTKRFRESTGFGVGSQRVGANDEFFTFLRAGGVGKFDIVTPGNGVVQGLAELGLIQPIDWSRLKNAGNLFSRFQAPEWATFNGQVFAAPVSWRTSPIVYNADTIGELPANWVELRDPAFTGRVVMTDDVLSHFTVWNRALGAENPVVVTKQTLNETVEAVLDIKRNQAVAFVTNMNDLAGQLVNGPAAISSVGMENATAQNAASGANLRLARPAPGDFSICEALCIVAESPRIDAAYAFIDEMLSTESQQWMANVFVRGTVATAAVPELNASIRHLYNYDDLDQVFSLSPLVGFPPLSTELGDTATYLDWVIAWDRVRYTGMEALSTPTPSPEPSPASS